MSALFLVNKTLGLVAASLLIVAAGCSGNAAPANTPTPTKASLPMVVAMSGTIDYPMTGADCKSGNAVTKGDPVTLTDPSGKLADTGKIIDALPSKGEDGSARCLSTFALNAMNPVDGEYTITYKDKTKKITAADMMNTVFVWKF